MRENFAQYCRVISGLLLSALVLACWPQASRADLTYVYAVQLSAVVQTNPPQITLNWESDPLGPTNYLVFRKLKEDIGWGAPTASLPGSALSFTDTNVAIGSSYEYQVSKSVVVNTGYSDGYIGYGYIYAGVEAPLQDQRGTVVLVVATNSTTGLDADLAQLKSDLVGDGWQVLRHDVSSNDTPNAVRSLILADYDTDPANVNTVFLFGHVPILYSGYLDYDEHGPRTVAADAFYGDVNNDWPTDIDPTNRPSYLPSDVQLMVGRVDFFDMPGNGAPTPWPSETALLQNYLRKEHLWRTHQIKVQRQALMGNRTGDYQGEAFAASGYRNFEPFVGPAKIIEANVADAAPDSERWISLETTGSYLWSYGCGGGTTTSIGSLGTHADDYYDVFSTDIVGQDAKAVFVMLFGSHLGDWQNTDDIMRSVLATPTMGLTCCLVGRPHWYCHHMALGETIGYSARLTMNNSSLYLNQSNTFTRAVFISLMGDPTLRADPVAPPADLTLVQSTNGVTLNWSASPDNVVGYHVYRARSPVGPFSRLTDSAVGATQFTDTNPPPAGCTYMVRAVALTSYFSGSYFNASEGIFNGNAPLPLVAQAHLVPGVGVQLTWSSQPGAVYHVEATPILSVPAWSNISGSLTAPGVSTSWLDFNAATVPQRFYRIVSP